MSHLACFIFCYAADLLALQPGYQPSHRTPSSLGCKVIQSTRLRCIASKRWSERPDLKDSHGAWRPCSFEPFQPTQPPLGHTSCPSSSCLSLYLIKRTFNLRGTPCTCTRIYHVSMPIALKTMTLHIFRWKSDDGKYFIVYINVHGWCITPCVDGKCTLEMITWTMFSSRIHWSDDLVSTL